MPVTDDERREVQFICETVYQARKKGAAIELRKLEQAAQNAVRAAFNNDSGGVNYDLVRKYLHRAEQYGLAAQEMEKPTE
jgi:hypothetical protein